MGSAPAILARSDGRAPHRAEPLSISRAVDPIAITHEVSWSIFPRKGLDPLLRNPLAVGVRHDIDPDKAAPGQADDDQAVKETKADGRNHEQIDGGVLRLERHL